MKKLKLSKFLKKNNAYKKFIKNYNKGFSGVPTRVKIGTAFWWEDTKQGWDYWGELDAKWSELIKEKYKPIYDMDWLLEKGKKK